MSVAAPPPIATPSSYVPEQVHIGPKREASLQDSHAPMRGLPSISPTMTTAEAQAKRQTWPPPNIIPGEFVFYREKNQNNECIAWVIASSNKTWKLTVLKANYSGIEKTSVAYYDHTDPDCNATGDPMAPWNNNGTFRRSMFGKMVADLLERQAQPPQIPQLVQDLLSVQQQQIVELQAQIKAINERNTPKTPKSN